MVAAASLLTTRRHPRARVRAARRARPAGSPRSGSRRSSLAVAVRGPLPDRATAAGRPTRLGGRSPGEADLLGAALLALALAGVILAFATADPEVAVFSPAGPLAASPVAARRDGAVLVWHLRRTAERRWCPRGAFARTPAWGALLVSFFVGAALIAALVDIPIFARITVYPTSQLDAALVLVRFLVALPVGALAGGYLIRRLPAGRGHRGRDGARGGRVRADDHVGADQPVRPGRPTVPLVLGGPRLRPGAGAGQRRAARRAPTTRVHGIASALLVVARMVGMLVGISALTTIGLRRYYAVPGRPPAADRGLRRPRPSARRTPRCSRQAGIAQVQTVFVGAAVCAVVAAVARAACCSEAPRTARSARTVCRAVARPFDDLLAANAAYAETFDAGGFDGVAHAGVAIVTCMDSRIDPLADARLSHGDAKIFRNPGGRVTPQALEALVLGVHLLGVEPDPGGPAHPLRDGTSTSRSCASGSASRPGRTPAGSVRRRRGPAGRAARRRRAASAPTR